MTRHWVERAAISFVMGCLLSMLTVWVGMVALLYGVIHPHYPTSFAAVWGRETVGAFIVGWVLAATAQHTDRTS